MPSPSTTSAPLHNVKEGPSLTHNSLPISSLFLPLWGAWAPVLLSSMLHCNRSAALMTAEQVPMPPKAAEGPRHTLLQMQPVMQHPPPCHSPSLNPPRSLRPTTSSRYAALSAGFRPAN